MGTDTHFSPYATCAPWKLLSPKGAHKIKADKERGKQKQKENVCERITIVEAQE